MPSTYIIQRITPATLGEHVWKHPLWADVPPIALEHFHARSSDHHPGVTVRAVHDGRSIYVRFDVIDRYVLARAEKFQDSVCIDSCVEFFVRPRPDLGYFNFEFNCGGTMLVYYMKDWTKTPAGFKKQTPLDWKHAHAIEIDHSLPKIVWPELTELTTWWLGAKIPLSVMEAYIPPLGELGELDGQTWTANFYKCADKSSHPHWASWSPIGEALNFHAPDKFGTIVFAAE